MPRNPRVANAFHAMRGLGIVEEKTKPVLKRLLKLYENNWELIEEENYRTLADAIFDDDETEVTVKKVEVENTKQQDCNEERQSQEEPERPLTRSRSRHQDVQASPPLRKPDPNLIETSDMIEPERPSKSLVLKHQEVQPSPSFCSRDPNLAETSDVTRSERPLKKLRLKHQDVQASPSLSIPDPKLVEISLKIPKVEEAESCETDHPYGSLKATHMRQSNTENASLESQRVLAQTLTRNKGKQLVSPRAVAVEERSVPSQAGRAKGPAPPQISSRGTRRTSLAVPLKEPKVEPDVDISRNKQQRQILLKPKDEPFTDDMPQPEVPTSLIHPDSLSEQDPLVGNSFVREPDGTELLVSQSPDGKDTTDLPFLSSEMRINYEPLDTPNGYAVTSDIASSSRGEEAINVILTIDLKNKTCPADCLGGRSIPFTPTNGSTDIHCDNEVPPSQTPRLLPQPDMSANSDNGKTDMQNGLKHANNCSLVAFQKCQSVLDDMKSVYVNDIAKGQEKVIISLVNDVNNDYPQPFHYVPQNVVFQNAYVNFSLARIGDGNCCSNCFGDCLSLSTPCACANETCGDFAYTSEGLVKDDFLKECISMNRDPKKHSLYFCKDCPLERSKTEDVLEPCKGHIVRKFIKECWYKCGCSKKCGNRVVQRGINRNLQVFMTPKGKGWGLRTLEDLPKGAFVCEYVGEVLTNEELYDRVSQSARGNGHSYPVLLDADWGAEVVLKDEEALCLDATYYGNAARFVNHRCGDSNLVEIPVEVVTPDHHYYHLAFFTTRKVKALEELTWDYGIDFDDHEHPVKAFQCHCGSKYCRNIKRSNRSRSAARRR